MIVNPDRFQAIVAKRNSSINTAWKVSKYGVFSGPYLPVFSLNTGKYGPENCPIPKNPHPLVQLRPRNFHPLDLGLLVSNKSLPLQMIINQLKENIIQGWILYVIRSFLKVGYCFQYQLSNNVWLFIDFFPFSWSKPCSQSYFKKLKTSFSSSSYSEKMCWSRGWAEASLSAFWRLSTLLCAAQKYHKLFFIYNYSNLW